MDFYLHIDHLNKKSTLYSKLLCKDNGFKYFLEKEVCVFETTDKNILKLELTIRGLKISKITNFKRFFDTKRIFSYIAIIEKI